MTQTEFTTATNKPDEVKKQRSERAEIPRLSGSTCREITPQSLYDSGEEVRDADSRLDPSRSG